MSNYCGEYNLERVQSWAKREFSEALDMLEMQLEDGRASDFEEFVTLHDPSADSCCKFFLDIGQTPNTLFAKIRENNNGDKTVRFLHLKPDVKTGKASLTHISTTDIDSPLLRENLQIAYRIVFAADTNRMTARLLRSVIAYRFLKAGHIDHFPISQYVKPRFFQQACEHLWEWCFYEEKDEDIYDLTWQVQETNLQGTGEDDDELSPEELKAENQVLRAENKKIKDSRSEPSSKDDELQEVKHELQKAKHELQKVKHELEEAKLEIENGEGKHYKLASQWEETLHELDKLRQEMEELKGSAKAIHQLSASMLK